MLLVFRLYVTLLYSVAVCLLLITNRLFLVVSLSSSECKANFMSYLYLCLPSSRGAKFILAFRRYFLISYRSITLRLSTRRRRFIIVKNGSPCASARNHECMSARLNECMLDVLIACACVYAREYARLSISCARYLDYIACVCECMS